MIRLPFFFPVRQNTTLHQTRHAPFRYRGGAFSRRPHYGQSPRQGTPFPEKAAKGCSIAAGLPAFRKKRAKSALGPGVSNMCLTLRCKEKS